MPRSLEQLADGRSADEVRAHFVARYGQWILLQPADPLIWLLPAVALLAGIGAFVWWLRRTPRAGRNGVAPAGIDDAIAGASATRSRRSMAELLLLVLVTGTVALAIAWPLLGAAPASDVRTPDPEREASEVRHRLALEALRDLEADRRAGSLDDAAYQAQRDEAEAHAASTRQALDAEPTSAAATAAPAAGASSWRLPALIGIVVAGLLLAGYALPAPIGIAERDARLERIRQLTDQVAGDPRDTAALAELSDLYLAGGTADDVGACAGQPAPDAGRRAAEPRRAPAPGHALRAGRRSGTRPRRLRTRSPR